ncbi:MAG: ATPase [Peptococcaceae bacterium BICA1-7]|nr:MAG: ATPase [Peptococcaceae bacterium BICA1-7]HBV96891.1 anti-sigma F factor [Desulfotomaculum sp.]
MQPVNRVSIQFSSIPANVAFARVAAGSFASQLDFTINDLEEIKVAVSEAVTNAIVHGYGTDAGKIIEMAAEIAGDVLTITVEDMGRGIDNLASALQPAFSTDPERMGLGFSFMQSFSDSFDIQSEPGKGTRVSMTRICKKGVTPRQGH